LSKIKKNKKLDLEFKEELNVKVGWFSSLRSCWQGTGAVILFLAFGVAGQASPITTFTIFDSTPAYSSVWSVSNAIDGNVATDYASLGGGTSTLVTFQFNQPYYFSEVDVTDRTQSGSATNTGAPVLGLSDFITHFQLIFSMNSDLSSPTQVVDVYKGVPGGTPTLADFQTTTTGLNVEALYVGYQVVAIGGASTNTGLAEISFDGVAAAAPEPASLACIGTGLCALGFFARKRRKSRA
jgi:hypothetical protein